MQSTYSPIDSRRNWEKLSGSSTIFQLFRRKCKWWRSMTPSSISLKPLRTSNRKLTRKFRQETTKQWKLQKAPESQSLTSSKEMRTRTLRIKLASRLVRETLEKKTLKIVMTIFSLPQARILKSNLSKAKTTLPLGMMHRSCSDSPNKWG